MAIEKKKKLTGGFGASVLRHVVDDSAFGGRHGLLGMAFGSLFVERTAVLSCFRFVPS
jgi:hypothetical protein